MPSSSMDTRSTSQCFGCGDANEMLSLVALHDARSALRAVNHALDLFRLQVRMPELVHTLEGLVRVCDQHSQPSSLF